MKISKHPPIHCTVLTTDPSSNLHGFVNVYTGEFTFDKQSSFIWINTKFNISLNYQGQDYTFDIKPIGGKYFVNDYKNQPIFQSFHLKDKLSKELPMTKTIQKMKI